jgi:hypothetical protein
MEIDGEGVCWALLKIGSDRVFPSRFLAGIAARFQVITDHFNY